MTTLNKQKDSAEQDAGNLDRFITVQRLRGIVRSDPPPRAFGLLVGHLATLALAITTRRKLDRPAADPVILDARVTPASQPVCDLRVYFAVYVQP